MSASLRELQRLCARAPVQQLFVLRFPPNYVLLREAVYDRLKREGGLTSRIATAEAELVTEHFLEARGFIKGYKT